MLWLGYLLCGLAGAALTLMAAAGRPTRGENLVGSHRITGPMALLFTLGTLLVLLAAPLPHTAANVAMYVAMPGLAVGMTFLPLAAYGHDTWPIKLLVPLIAASPAALGHGAAVHAALPWLGAALLALPAVGSTGMLLRYPLQRLRGQFVRLLRRGSHEPSEWERGQYAYHREQWQKVPADADVGTLLAHARSLAPDVRAACHERLAAHPELAPGLAKALVGDDPSNALWYLQHHMQGDRSTFAAPVAALLAQLRATLPDRMRHDDHPHPWTGDLMPALECGLEVLRAGGGVRAELEAWQRELASQPKFARSAKQLARWLAKIR
ncbi:MAG: hypothetical protein MUC36_10140 [Planctomycetes bacterium]|jgi:hypothetical protein|nr:hypothetical protein [Planctomycetota bacterium]